MAVDSSHNAKQALYRRVAYAIGVGIIKALFGKPTQIRIALAVRFNAHIASPTSQRLYGKQKNVGLFIQRFRLEGVYRRIVIGRFFPEGVLAIWITPENSNTLGKIRGFRLQLQVFEQVTHKSVNHRADSVPAAGRVIVP